MANKSSARIHILGLFLENTQLSKTQVMNQLGRKDHGNISKICDYLKDNRLIKIQKTKFGPGRAEIFYSITKKGLIHIVENSANPEEFWTALIYSACYHSQLITWQKLTFLLELYLSKYLKYYQKDRFYSLQLDQFNDACDTWFQKAIIPKKISPAQKVLEVLAVNPNLTLDQIVKATEEDASIIESVIKMYTEIQHQPVLVDAEGHHDTTFYDVNEWRFVIHRVITQTVTSAGDNTFNLSLSGVIMVLYIIVKNHDGKLPDGLFHAYYFQQYFDMVVKNYKNKIPLIFGKWSLLQSLLGENAYHCFDVILNKNVREKSFKNSVAHSGNRELYEGLTESIRFTRKELIQLQTTGTIITTGMPSENGHTILPNAIVDVTEISQKMRLVFFLSQYLSVLINPMNYDVESFYSMYHEEQFFGPEIAKEMSSYYSISYLEKCLAFESSLVYYLSLKRDDELLLNKPTPVPLEQVFYQILTDENIGPFLKEHFMRIKNYYMEVSKKLELLDVRS